MSEREQDRLVRSYARGELSRRQFIGRGLALGLSLTSLAAIVQACAPASPTTGSPASAAPASSSAPKATELVVLTWGGKYKDALSKWVNDPFEKANGVKVLVQEQPNAQASLAKLQIEKDRPTVDVWLTSGHLPLLLAQQGGLQELNRNGVPTIADIVPQTLVTSESKTFAAGIHLGARGIAVNRERIRSFVPDYSINMLKSWTFLYRPELRDQIKIPSFESGPSINIGMTAPYGGSATEEEKFFAAMKRLAPNAHIVTGGAAQVLGDVEAYQSKEIVASGANIQNMQQLVQAGVPVDLAYPLDPLIISLDYIVALKNGPAGGDLALKFVNQFLGSDVMTGYSQQLGVLPTNTKAVLPNFPGMPSLSIDDILKYGWAIDNNWVIQNFDKWLQRFNKEIVPLYGGRKP